MKKLISIFSVVLCIAIVFSACSGNNSLDETTTTTSNTTTNTTTTTTAATTESKTYYPTVDEYMESFDSKYGQYVNYTKDTNTSSNSVMINWTVDYNQAISIDYSVSLFLNDDNRVTWCSVTVLHEKFYNCFKDLLSSQYQYDVMVETIMAPYLLACLHNGQDYNDDEFGDLVTDVSKAILVNGRKYDGKALDCKYYVNLDEETGITSMLDYGGNTHK